MENSFQEFVLDACLERAHAANSAEDASWRSTCTRRQQELGKRRGSAFCMSRAPGKEKSVLSFFFFALSGKKSAFSRFAGLSLALSLSIALSLRQALQRGFFLSRCLPPSLSLSLPPAAERSTRLSVKPETTALRTFSRSRRNSARITEALTQAREAHSLSSFQRSRPTMSAADFANAKGERFAVALLGEDGAPTQNVVVQVREKPERGDVNIGSETAGQW